MRRGLGIVRSQGSQERDGAHDQIAGRRHMDGSGFAHRAHEERGRGKTCDSGAEGIDSIERTDGPADIGGALDEVLGEEGQSAAHEQRGDEQEKEGGEAGDGGGAACCELRDPMEEMKGAESEEADRALDRAEGAQRGKARQRGKAAAGEAAEAQAQHEYRNNDGYRFNVDAVDGKQGPLPDDLIEESGKAGDEEQQIVRPDPVRRSRIFGARGQRGISAGAHRCLSC